MNKHRLTLECLNGPHDDARIEVIDAIEMRRTGSGPLAFSWDTTLGDPQCRFAFEQDAWVVQYLGAQRGTHCMSHPVCDEARFPLQEGLVLRASFTWLLVAAAE